MRTAGARAVAPPVLLLDAPGRALGMGVGGVVEPPAGAPASVPPGLAAPAGFAPTTDAHSATAAAVATGNRDRLWARAFANVLLSAERNSKSRRAAP
jgi:hypothetical protein